MPVFKTSGLENVPATEPECANPKPESFAARQHHTRAAQHTTKVNIAV
jgi:hypothetical protein